MLRALVFFLAVTSMGCAVSVVPSGTLRHVEGAPASTTLDPAHIRVLVWNVYKASLPGWWDDFSGLVPSHDVFLLQEGLWRPEDEARHKGLGVDWWMGVTFINEWSAGDPATGTIIGGKSPVHRASSRHSRYLEPVVGTPKSHSFGRFALAGRDEELLAMSVHAINFRLGLTAFGDHVRSALRDAAHHEGPVIVAGDFNTWSEERTDYLFDLMTQHGFESPYPRSTDDGPSDGRTLSGSWYLDHAFLRGLEVRGEPQVLTTIDSSDHEALSFEVGVPRPR